MKVSLRLRPLEALHGLTARLASESGGGLLSDCLDVLLDATNARAAAAFSVDQSSGKLESVAERGLPLLREKQLSCVRSALGAYAARTVASRRTLELSDIRHEAGLTVGVSELVAIGVQTLLCVPLVYRRTVLGCFVLLFEDASFVDQDQHTLVAIVANSAALALERETQSEQEAPEVSATDLGHMASLGLLTASVAHELRGPAGALVLQQEELARLIEQLEAYGDSSDTALGGTVAELSELSSDIQGAVTRLRETLEQLSTLSRRESSAECLELAHVARDAMCVLVPHLEHRGVILNQHYESASFTVGRRDNLAQVVMNLVFNAADAAQTNGRPEVWVRVSERGDDIVLCVEDNGPGVPNSQVERIFQPFYTTKRRGEGTGLGLKIVSDVVTAHGGHIEVHERAGGGAAFQVFLPRAHEESTVVSLSNAETHVPGVQPVELRDILVIDDDPVFSRSMRRVLKPHMVRTAGGASEAEVLLLDPAYKPDLILCDVFLPGANGDVLYKRVLRARPEIAERFVFVTGGGLGKGEAESIRASRRPTLFKPLDRKSLLNLLESPNRKSVPVNSVRTLSKDQLALELPLRQHRG